MIVAIATHPESQNVERFGHDFPVLLLDIEGQELRGTQLLEPQDGCCRHLAARLKGADVLICTGLGQGAAKHLKDFGVDVAVVPEGVPASAALATWSAQTLDPSAAESSACGGHGATGHACGCGGHERDHGNNAGCGCGGHERDHGKNAGCGCGGHDHAHGNNAGCGCKS
jgi:predicted Fe-Mo cluster-binding NifX family protein